MLAGFYGLSLILLYTKARDWETEGWGDGGTGEASTEERTLYELVAAQRRCATGCGNLFRANMMTPPGCSSLEVRTVLGD